MRRTRGIRLGRRIVKVFRWVCRSRRSNGYRRLGSTSSKSPSCKSKSQAMMKLLNWGRSLKKGALGLCCSARPRALDYCKVGFEPVEVPKGHLVPVYVGQKEDESYRVLVPIIYFNHPLFGNLLKEAEKEFGYDHPGGITIPCPFSEFERVQTCIAAGTPGRKSMRYRD